MAGYAGYRMSNNAVDAYRTGEKPISKWTKKDILKEIRDYREENELCFSMELLSKVSVKVLREKLLYNSSWHHTSNHYNRTDFYSIDKDELESLTDEKIQQMSAIKKEEKEAPLEIRCKCAFLEWTGTRRNPKATEYIEEGVIRGEWFFRQNGSKKKTTSNGFRIIEKFN